MIPLASHLDDRDFDALLALARSRLPALAPEWTDYNYHDPGIMLVELLAWIADTQIYSLARNRVDERLAMARLLGVRPRGAVSATGTLYPDQPPTTAIDLAPATRIVPSRATAPRVETIEPLTLLPIRLAAVTLHGDGAPVEVTRINQRARASFAPFGEPPGATSALTLRFAAAGGSAARGTLLSLGVQVVCAGEAADGLGAIDAFLGDGEPLKCEFDSSHAMQRSGAMILALSKTTELDGLEIVLRPRAPTALMPRLLSIAPNAIPVEQRATFIVNEFGGTGRPGQTITIDPRAQFANDEVADGRVWRLVDQRALQVHLGIGAAFEEWQRGEFAAAEPGDKVYRIDERPDGTAIALRFGNGINGAKPPIGAPFKINLQVSCGGSGDVASSMEWLIDGHRIHARNAEPITGGANAQDADGALRDVRRILREGRLLATSPQIRAAVGKLPKALGIARAEVEDGWERGRRKPGTPATRTLLVARRGTATETPAWRRAIEQRLRPRIALGERLIVVPLEYRSFHVHAALTVASGRVRADVEAAIAKELHARFALVEGKAAGKYAAWPMGRDVDATAVAGWVRRIEGVARVADLTLVTDDGSRHDLLPIGRGTLPRFVGIQFGAPEVRI